MDKIKKGDVVYIKTNLPWCETPKNEPEKEKRYLVEVVGVFEYHIVVMFLNTMIKTSYTWPEFWGICENV